jgi:indolepyruvate ferredoxin oxidoreductase alpha subunit
MLDKRKINLADRVLLGDQAVALGAIHAGISAAYGYPGTPSTEILEFLIERKRKDGSIEATWCANEKTAFEAALGASMVGKRVLVTMKHVGLNVAADPFMNATMVDVHGGLVLAVADDPGMHSSQNEQDSRYFAEMAQIPCLEPSHQQEAYEMTKAAFELSERYRMPVMVRMVTRLCHSRAAVSPTGRLPQRPLSKTERSQGWILLPAISRKQWRGVLEQQQSLKLWSVESPFNPLSINPDGGRLGVITTGIARNYLLENLPAFGRVPSTLHIGAYPIPKQLVRELAETVDEILVLEDGYPHVERYLHGLLEQPLVVRGRMTGDLPPDGELDPDVVRAALGIPPRAGHEPVDVALPVRPPQLCRGCPHCDAYSALLEALEPFEQHLVTGDIGCYTLGALPPYRAIESCVCMGASIGMAKGAADMGMHPVVAVIGDSTFLHSGMTPLLDAAQADANMTVLILDNEYVAMTGAQETLAGSTRIADIVRGLGIPADHVQVFEGHPSRVPEFADVIRRELEHRGLSVIVAVRPCLEGVRKHKGRQKEEGAKA